MLLNRNWIKYNNSWYKVIYLFIIIKIILKRWKIIYGDKNENIIESIRNSRL